MSNHTNEEQTPETRPQENTAVDTEAAVVARDDDEAADEEVDEQPPRVLNPTEQRLSDMKLAANTAYGKGDFTEAIKLYTEAIDFGDKEKSSFSSGEFAEELIGELVSNRCAARLSIGDNAEALLDAENVVKRRPNWYRGFQRVGQALLALGKKPEALEAWEQAVQRLEDVVEISFIKDVMQLRKDVHANPEEMSDADKMQRRAKEEWDACRRTWVPGTLGYQNWLPDWRSDIAEDAHLNEMFSDVTAEQCYHGAVREYNAVLAKAAENPEQSKMRVSHVDPHEHSSLVAMCLFAITKLDAQNLKKSRKEVENPDNWEMASTCYMIRGMASYNSSVEFAKERAFLDFVRALGYLPVNFEAMHLARVALLDLSLNESWCDAFDGALSADTPNAEGNSLHGVCVDLANVMLRISHRQAEVPHVAEWRQLAQDYVDEVGTLAAKDDE